MDTNPAQLHLCELRRTATQHLTREEQLQLLGADPSAIGTAGASERLALYERIRPYLPEPAQTFWDACRDREIAFGVQHVGCNDVFMHNIQERLQAAGFDPLRDALHDDRLHAWQAVYTNLMTPVYIRELFGLPSEALAARISAIAGYIGACHFRALQQANPECNPFLTTVFASAYASAAGEDGLPLYLQTQGQSALRQLGTHNRLHLVAGNMLEHLIPLTTAHGLFDLISISNIADWMTNEQFSTAVTQARNCLAPGGALLARTGTGSATIIELMSRQLHVDVAFNTRLATIERGPWFRTVSAGFRV